MNDMIDTSSDLRDLIAVDFSETVETVEYTDTPTMSDYLEG